MILGVKGLRTVNEGFLLDVIWQIVWLFFNDSSAVAAHNAVGKIGFVVCVVDGIGALSAVVTCKINFITD